MTHRAIAAHAAWSLAAIVALSGCAHTHLRDNAPGIVDVSKPPEHIEERVLEEPADPGEHRLALTYSVLTGGGVQIRERADDTGGFALSLEVALFYNEFETSHVEDSSFDALFAVYAPGIHFGYQAIAPEAIDLSVLRPFYVELQPVPILSFGWQADFERALHGPQLTLSLWLLYFRTGYLFEFGGQFELGILIRGFHVWSWSR